MSFLCFAIQSGDFRRDRLYECSYVGPGVREIRVRESAGAYRVIYVARFADAVYVLHAFQKKTQKTARADLEVAKQRYRIACELAQGEGS